MKRASILAAGTLLSLSSAYAFDTRGLIEIEGPKGITWYLAPKTIEGTDDGKVAAWVWATYPTLQPGPSWDGRPVQFNQEQNYWIFDCKWKKAGILRTIFYRDEKMQLFSSREDQRKEIMELVGLKTAQSKLLHIV